MKARPTVPGRTARISGSRAFEPCQPLPKPPINAGLMSTHAEKHWKQIDAAPVGVGLRLIVADHSGHHFLPYECKLTATGWINTATGHPLAVHPTHWQLHHVETLPSKRAWARRAASNR